MHFGTKQNVECLFFCLLQSVKPTQCLRNFALPTHLGEEHRAKACVSTAQNPSGHSSILHRSHDPTPNSKSTFPQRKHIYIHYMDNFTHIGHMLILVSITHKKLQSHGASFFTEPKGLVCIILMAHVPCHAKGLESTVHIQSPRLWLRIFNLLAKHSLCRSSHH